MCLCLVTHSCPTLCDPTDSSLPGSSVHGILQARIPEWIAVLSSRGSSQPRDQTQVSLIAGRFFTIWATRETQEYWRGSLSLFQGNFPIQELNWGLLHCRWILYQLSYPGSPWGTNPLLSIMKPYPIPLITLLFKLGFSVSVSAWGKLFLEEVLSLGYLKFKISKSYSWSSYLRSPHSSIVSFPFFVTTYFYLLAHAPLLGAVFGSCFPYTNI